MGGLVRVCAVSNYREKAMKQLFRVATNSLKNIFRKSVAKGKKYSFINYLHNMDKSADNGTAQKIMLLRSIPKSGKKL
jgi:hypothetical protein